MRSKHWKLIPCFVLGLLVMDATAWCVGTMFGMHPGLQRVHWFFWLLLTLVFPLLALFIMGRERRGLYPVSYLVNAVGAGCAFGVVLAGSEASFGELMRSAALPVLTALVMCLLYTLWRRTRWIAIGFTFLGIFAIFGGLFLGERFGAEMALGTCFGFLFFTALPLTCGKALSGEDWLEQLAFSGFGTYLIVLLGAIMILAEDGLDGLESIFDGMDDIGNGVTNNAPQKRRR